LLALSDAYDCPLSQVIELMLLTDLREYERAGAVPVGMRKGNGHGPYE
jgi:hypothetical protein